LVPAVVKDMSADVLGCIAVVAVTIFLLLAGFVHAIVSGGPPRFDDYCEAMYVKWGMVEIAASQGKSSQWTQYKCEAKLPALERKYPGWNSY
jgi:hypothetical protein